jgi:hypothetical protein
MLVARALKNSQLTRQPPGERHAYLGDRTPGLQLSLRRILVINGAGISQSINF